MYDNDSTAFKYRAKTYCDEKGVYSFKTILPVPYDVGGGTVRPAHFHMLISADGYQTLITQLYFTGDKNIDKDPSASSAAAKRRILDIKNDDHGGKTVWFNVTMSDKLPADAAVIDRLVGNYVHADKKKTEELYKKDNLLWLKDAESINGGYPLEYIGDNTFEYYGWESKYKFTVQKDGAVKLAYKGSNWLKEKEEWEAIKEK